MSVPLSRRRFLRASAAVGAAVGTAGYASPLARLAGALEAGSGAGPLKAGVGVADLTPALGDTLFGYVRPDRLANGVAVRLWTRTVVLSDGVDKLALVTVDLGASLDKDDVVARLSDLGYTMENVVLAATHTHAGPETWTAWLEDRIADSVRRADADLGPAVAGWARGTLHDVNVNRSLSAHLANHGFDVPPHEGVLDLDPEGPDHPRDLNLRLLRIDRPDGVPLAAWSNFAVHPTNFPNTNTLYSADLSGIAMLRFERSFGTAGPAAPPGTGAPLGILANGNEGDLISLYQAHNPHSCADLMGRRVAAGMRALWDEAGAGLSRDVALSYRWTRVGFEGQEVEPGRPVASQAMFGLPFLGGAENGPSPFYPAGTEGQRLPEGAAHPVHGRKILAMPAPWRNNPELQLVRIGSTVLVPVPGEATTEAGRRINRAVLDAAPRGVTDATVVGLANDYVGYFTTPEEYDQQHYEGGHTVFGKWTSLVVIRAGQDLAASMAASEPAPAPRGGDPFFDYPPQGGDGAPVGTGAATGAIEDEPPCEVARMEVVAFTWRGGPDGLDRPVGAPFVVLERRDADTWTVVDSDLGVGFQWTAGGPPSQRPEAPTAITDEGLHLARHEIPATAPTGTYRFRVTAARYTLETEPFEVVANRSLVVRGVQATAAGDRAVLTFRAQHPPPVVDEHLLWRPRSPSGGTVRFTVGSDEHVAAWDPAAEGWVATVRSDPPVTEVTVADGGLADGAGNTSGAGATFAVGDVAPIVWPPDMAVGGTDRDWHGHAPSEVETGRAEACPAPGSGDPQDGAGGPGDGGSGAAPATPATGGGSAWAGGAVALAAAALARQRTR